MNRRIGSLVNRCPNMDAFLKQRQKDPRFALHGPRPEVALRRAAERPWYQSSGIVKHTYNASAKEGKKEESKKESSSSSSSESDGEGGRRKKQKTKETKGNAPGYDGPDKCWDGYKRVRNKMRGEPGSCEKA